MFNNFGKQLYDNVIANSRYMLYINGLGRSLFITLGALLLGGKEDRHKDLPFPICHPYPMPPAGINSFLNRKNGICSSRFWDNYPENMKNSHNVY